MRFGTFVVPVACWFMLVLVQFVAVLAGTAGALGGAVAVGLLSSAVLQFFQADLNTLGVILVAAVASLTGIAPRLLSQPSKTLTLFFAPVLAFAVSGAVVLVPWRSRLRCALCGHGLGSGVWFRCPRCGLAVCDRDCWDFDNLRCRLCQQNSVPMPVFTDINWWNQQLGPRLTQGRCQLCLASGSEADLRVCRNCGRPQCRACWDAANGRCNHCRWLIPDLPPLLRAYLPSPSPQAPQARGEG
jgi:hypothetical protein